MEARTQLERVLFTRKGKAGWATSFPSLLEQCTKDLLQFHPTQRPAKLSCLETARNKEEGRRVGATTISYTAGVSMVPGDLLCKGTPAAFTTEDFNHPCRSCRSPQLSSRRISSWTPHRFLCWGFLPYRFSNSPATWVPPYSPHLTHWGAGSIPAVRSSCCSCLYAKWQPGPQWLIPTSMCALMAISCSCAPAHCQLKSHHL